MQVRLTYSTTFFISSLPVTKKYTDIGDGCSTYPRQHSELPLAWQKGRVAHLPPNHHYPFFVYYGNVLQLGGVVVVGVLRSDPC